MTRRFLINAANLHTGGGVQVATSFIAELALMKNLPVNLTVWASIEVDQNLKAMKCDISNLPTYKIVNVHGIRLLFSKLNRSINDYDAVFTIFGPLYVWRPSFVNIVGFAQPWIIYKNNEIYEKLPWFERFILRFKFSIQAFFFKKTDVLIVELEHVRQGLISAGISSADKIHVVNNCLSSIYYSPEKWLPVELPKVTGNFKFGFVGRNYPHKNTEIFPLVREILYEKFNLNVDFYVTFNDVEWENCSSEFKNSVINVGALSVVQCPTFYKKMDGVIFPSLLECFSATPLEAMAMERPLFASERSFNRDICQNYANYFDPLDPASAAAVIANYIKDGSKVDEVLQDAKKHAFSFSNSQERAHQYLDCLIDSVN